MNSQEIEEQLHDEVARYWADPYGFVMFAYPWGEKGTILEDWDGPDDWQREVLQDIGRQVRLNRFDGKIPVKPQQHTTGSGHGIGKSALTGFITNWIMSTRPHAQGTVTANTSTQLETKTWAQIAKWTKLCITAHWFTVNTGRGSMKMYHNEYPETWFCSAQTCREENSEAFAGQHAANSTSFYIFDEASNVPDSIWEVAEGGLTDGEPMFFAFGNPTRNTGKFHRITYGSEKHRWKHRSIDSRDCKLPNKALIKEWEGVYGENSDFFRVRVKGVPPNASDMQFIDSQRIWDAQKREPVAGLDDPLICGVDIARGGADNNVIYFRRGLDGKTIPPIIIPGEETRDSMKLVAKIVQVINDGWRGQKPDAVFADGTGVGGPVIDRCVQLGYDVFEVQFGGKAPDRHYSNMRVYMWQKMKDWLLRGSIPKDEDLELDLVGPELRPHNKSDQMVLESKEDMKKRGLNSPDIADGLALTFAFPVAPRSHNELNVGQSHRAVSDFDPNDFDSRGEGGRAVSEFDPNG